MDFRPFDDGSVSRNSDTIAMSWFRLAVMAGSSLSRWLDG
jgi:hypothetical protein